MSRRMVVILAVTLAWLLRAGDPSTAQFACGSALEAVRNRNLRWVIEQVAQSSEELPDSWPGV